MYLLQKKILFISISVLLYLAALILPAYNYTGGHPNPLPGYECIIQGFFTLGFIEDAGNPFPFISWLSNVPLAAGLFVMLFARRKKGFAVASGILFAALIMSLGSLIIYSAPKEAYSPNIGCFVWIFSILLMWAGAFLLKRELDESYAA